MNTQKETPMATTENHYGELLAGLRAVKSKWGQLEELIQKQGSPDDMDRVLDDLATVKLDFFRFRVAVIRDDSESRAEALLAQARRQAEDAAREAEALERSLLRSRQYGQGMHVTTAATPMLHG